jgi:hypothetical protein
MSPNAGGIGNCGVSADKYPVQIFMTTFALVAPSYFLWLCTILICKDYVDLLLSKCLSMMILLYMYLKGC